MRYTNAIQEGTVTEKKGWHNPNEGLAFRMGRHGQQCGCKTKDGNKGTYRDITVEFGDETLHYYHQTLVVKKAGPEFTLSNGGYFTSTTKERINRYLPSPWFVKQRDFEWYLINRETGEEWDFSDGMTINAATGEVEQ